MSDLISRSRAIENIWDVFNSYANDSQRFDECETEAINNAFKVLQKTIEGQPTAYDLDKVVEEFEFRKSYLSYNGLIVSVPVVTFENSIDIVRKGGVE